MRAASLRVIALQLVVFCTCLCSGCRVEPQPQDFSEFQEFEYWSGPLPAAGEVAHALIRHEGGQRYSLRMSVVTVVGTQQTPGQTEDLPPRDLGEAEVERLLGIFADIRFESYVIGSEVYGIFPSFRWDEFTTYESGAVANSMSADTADRIRTLLRDLAAHQ
jgi:hypothetical protein